MAQSFLVFLVILIQASSPIRHAAYEVFKLVHIALVALVLVGLYLHLKDLPGPLSNIKIAMAIWVVDVSTRTLHNLINLTVVISVSFESLSS